MCIFVLTTNIEALPWGDMVANQEHQMILLLSLIIFIVNNYFGSLLHSRF